MKKHPLIFEVTDLPMEGITLSGEVSFADLDIQEEARLFLPNPVQYEFHISPVSGAAVLLRGKVSSEILMTCDRCETNAPFSIRIDDICHEYENAFGREIDLTDDIREDILLSLPSHFLCREDCRGLCPICGTNLNTGHCDCAEKQELNPSEEENDNPFSKLDELNL